MSDNRRQILDMLSEGKITAPEAERLIMALERGVVNDSAGTGTASASIKARAKYLRVVVESNDGDGPTKVNVRVPMQLLRAGVKLASIIPIQARESINDVLSAQGVKVDFTKLKPDDLEELVEQLNELTVDVDEKNNKVRIFCE